MRGLSLALLTTLAAISLGCAGRNARVGFAVGLGAAPICPYGYFEEPPYDCAPYGYYGPEWFNNGLFIGAGPWFHGRRGFRGQINSTYRRDHGFTGAFPQRGAAPGPAIEARNFHGNETHDGRGHVVRPGRR
ncbi:MAG TPA: hypothetical protein VHC90_02870 [Bryobacteraceae bacterium]|nr:hypothetical protein [Bryobacteraceae bacterium]